jgi:hypothetical protein
MKGLLKLSEQIVMPFSSYALVFPQASPEWCGRFEVRCTAVYTPCISKLLDQGSSIIAAKISQSDFMRQPQRGSLLPGYSWVVVMIVEWWVYAFVVGL